MATYGYGVRNYFDNGNAFDDNSWAKYLANGRSTAGLVDTTGTTFTATPASQGRAPAPPGQTYGSDGKLYPYKAGQVDSKGVPLTPNGVYGGPNPNAEYAATTFTPWNGQTPNTTGWQTKETGYDFDTMPQSERDYVGSFIYNLANEAPDKARTDYLNAQKAFGFTDDFFSKFTSMYGGPGFTGAQINTWKNAGAPPPPSPGPPPPSPPPPSQVDSFLDNRVGDGPPAMQGYQRNPYLDDMAAGLTRQAVDTWTRQIDPSIRSGAMVAGGFGGSRQGVVEANALNDWSHNLSDSLSNLYGNDYQQSMTRNLQKYLGDQQYDLGLGNLALGNQNSLQNYALGLGNLGLGYYNAGNNYDLGLRNNDLGYANLDANIAQRNFENHLAGANLGLSALDRLFNYNQAATNTANTAQNTQLENFLKFLAAVNATGATGSTTTTSGSGTGAQSNDLVSQLIKGVFDGDFWKSVFNAN